MPPGYKFVIADDHPLFRGALKQALAGLAENTDILEAGDFDSAKALIVENDDVDRPFALRHAIPWLRLARAPIRRFR